MIVASMGTAGLSFPSQVLFYSNHSTGTMTGLGTYFKEAKPSVYRIA